MKRRHRTKARRETKPSREMVKAWLATVIAPTLDALRIEAKMGSEAEQAGDQKVRGRGDWSFQVDRQEFEYLFKMEDVIAPPVRANRDQLFRFYPDLKKLQANHDKARETLLAAMKEAYHLVVRHPRFSELARDVPEGERRYLGEYLVNGLHQVTSRWTAHQHWNQHARQYLDIELVDEGGQPFWPRLVAAADEFRQARDELKARLEALQEELADSHRLPPVDPTDIATV